jgi:hypothetical protein
MMCSQGRSQADEGTAGRVSSEWHQGQVEPVWGVAGDGLSGGLCRPSKLGSGRWPLRRGGLHIPLPTERKGFVCPASQRSTKIEDVLIHFLGNAVTGGPGTLVGFEGRGHSLWDRCASTREKVEDANRY